MEVDDFFTKNLPKLRSMCLKYCAHESNHDDILHDFYLFLREKHPCDLEKQTGYFFGFLLKNKHFTNNPENKYLTTDNEIQHEPTYDHTIEDIDEINAIKKQLKEPYRRIFDMIFVEGNHTDAELAERLNTTNYGANQSKKQLYKEMKIKYKPISKW